MPKIDSIKDIKRDFKPKKYRAWHTSENQVTNNNNDSPGNTSMHASVIISAISPSDVHNWEFHDRPETELGDIKSLADDIRKIGQQQPCIVRPSNNSKFKYELIVGERRWRACSLIGIDLQAVIKDNLSDLDAALSQSAENDNRQDLSDYAKGMSFANLISKNVLKQKDLTEKLGKSPQYISRLLSFSKIPNEIIESVSEWSLVTSGTSETIVRLSKKGEDYVKAIISQSSKIRTKKVGEKSLERSVLNIVEAKSSSTTTNKKVFTNDGRHIFTWRLDNNSLPSIHFPKHINNLFLESKLDTEEFTNELTTLLDKKFKSI